MDGRCARGLLCVAAVACALPSSGEAACCYFAAKDQDIQQPSQKVFITWDPGKKLMSFTVQPKFEGNAQEFGMVIPTPGQPTLHEMPRDFFKELAVFSLLKHRRFPQSNLMQGQYGVGGTTGTNFGSGYGGIYYPGYGSPYGQPYGGMYGQGFSNSYGMAYGSSAGLSCIGVGRYVPTPPRPKLEVVETGLVGSLDYKVIKAERADDLYKWLKDNKYQYAGDEATLDFYVRKKWYFTVMKIDTMQMKKNKDGSYAGEVTPTRFQFTTEKPIYPLKITQLSVKDKTEALFYVQAPFKMDLEGDNTYQYQWVGLLDGARGCTAGNLPGNGDDWLTAIQGQKTALLKRAQELGFSFVQGKRPQPNARGRSATSLEWAKQLTEDDVAVLQGKKPYSESVPNPDTGFKVGGVGATTTRQGIGPVLQPGVGGLGQPALGQTGVATQMRMTTQGRPNQFNKGNPNGYLVREAPAEDVQNLRLLVGHLEVGAFIVKFRKTFTRGEMNDDLLLVPARLGDAQDTSAYEETMPVSPP